jgi:hypothetical protein
MAIPVGILEWNPSTGSKSVSEFHAAGSPDTATNANYSFEALDSFSVAGTEWQVGATWDENEKLVLGKRSKTGSTWNAWTKWVYDGTGGRPNIARTVPLDNHNFPTPIIDKNGLVHVWYDMHASALEYRRSTAAVASWDGALTAEQSMTGLNEAQFTYPQVFRDASNDVCCGYRNGSAGNGDFYVKVWDGSAWAGLAGAGTDGLVIDGKNSSPVCSPYWSGPPAIDSNGNWHVSWIWSDTGIASRNNLSYVKYKPATDTFEKRDGTAQTVPITRANVEIIDPVANANGLAAFNCQVVDSNNRVHVFYGKNDTTKSNFERAFHIYDTGSAWSTPAAISPLQASANGNFANSTLDAVIDDDDTIRVVCVHPTDTTNGVWAYVSTNALWTTWRVLNLTLGDVSGVIGTGETGICGSHDIYQWQTHGVYMTMVPLAPASHLSFPASFSDAVEATIANPSSSLTDPFFVIDGDNLPAAFWDNVQSDLGDVRLSDANGGMLPCYVHNYDYATQKATIIGKWFGTLATSGTQKVRVHCGNASVTTDDVDSLFGQHNVWHQLLIGVYPDGGGNNASRWANNLTMSNATAGDSTGPFGTLKATNYNGTTALGSKASVSQPSAAPTSAAIVAWAKSDSTTASQVVGGITDTADTDRFFVGFFAGAVANDPLQSHIAGNGQGSAAASSATGYGLGWHHAAFRFPSTTSRFAMLDGVAGAEGTDLRTPDAIDRIAIGARVRTTTDAYFDGLLSMVQFYNSHCPSAAEIAWQSSQSDQATFWGTWADIAGVATRRRRFLVGAS